MYNDYRNGWSAGVYGNEIDIQGQYWSIDSTRCQIYTSSECDRSTNSYLQLKVEF